MTVGMTVSVVRSCGCRGAVSDQCSLRLDVVAPVKPPGSGPCPMGRALPEGHPREFAARRDARLGEDVPEVEIDGSGAEEQLGRDFPVRETLRDERRDLRLLSGERDAGGVVPLAGGLAGGPEF